VHQAYKTMNYEVLRSGLKFWLTPRSQGK